MALKKEFSERDVQRMRNLIQGKNNDRTVAGVGYQKKEEIHKEGDIWEEGGITWTIKDNLKQNITKLDSAKELAKTPLFCPKCSKIMKKKVDPDYYRSHKMCFDCVVDFEHELRKKGEWDSYQKNIKNDRIDNMIEEFKSFMDEKRYEKSDNFVTEAGDVERWFGKIDQDRVDDYIKETVEYLESLKQ